MLLAYIESTVMAAPPTLVEWRTDDDAPRDPDPAVLDDVAAGDEAPLPPPNGPWRAPGAWATGLRASPGST